jgi:lipopolysaccharide transport system ATP-binding protein
VLERSTGLRVYFDLLDEQGTILVRSFHDELADGVPTTAPGRYTSRAAIPANLLGPTTYDLVINSGIFNVRHCLPADAVRLRLRVENTGQYNRAYPMDTYRARLAPAIAWQTSEAA